MKAAIFHPKVREEIRKYPENIRKAFGEAIFDLQMGKDLKMPLSKPMPGVALGVEELRIKDSSGAYRIFYFKKFAKGSYFFILS